MIFRNKICIDKISFELILQININLISFELIFFFLKKIRVKLEIILNIKIQVKFLFFRKIKLNKLNELLN